jgi:hypothetical protein
LYSDVFVSNRWKDAGKFSSSVAAFIVIGPSKFSRTMDPSLADIHVFRTFDIPDVTYFELVNVATELARELELGYMECVMSVSVTCDNLIRGLTEHAQFKQVATLPCSVNMANFIGLTDSVVLIRNIAPPEYHRQVETV